MKRLAFILIAAVILLTGCSIGGTGNSASYHQIAQEEAKEMMTKNDGHVIVDVRRQDEYDEGHIPGAVLIPNESITDKQPEQLPDLNQVILIYCRSGRRSKEASQKLADLFIQKRDCRSIFALHKQRVPVGTFSAFGKVSFTGKVHQRRVRICAA